MSKKILFCSLFILIFLIPSKQDPNAKTWERHNTTVYADSIIAAIDRGESINISQCIISDSLIKEGTSEKPCTIKTYIDINNSIFSDKVSFQNSYFMEDFDFVFDSCSNEVNFVSAKFHGNVYFNGTVFHDYTDFSHATFFGVDINFSGAAFEAVADFSDAIFDTTSRTRFWGTDFTGDVGFMGTIFGDYTDFDLATFDRIADFSGARFKGRLKLTPSEFKKIFISWDQLKNHLEFDRTGNYRLMKNLEELRQLEDADGVYLFLKDQERMRKSPWVRYPEYWFIQQTCGYGRKPLNTLILSGIIIMLFAIFFTNSKAIKEIGKESGRRWLPRLYRDVPKTRGKRFYYALYFSLHTFIIGVVSDWHATDEFLIKRMIEIKLFKFGPNIKLTPRFRFRTLSMIEGALGWILVIILIISLERTIGR